MANSSLRKASIYCLAIWLAIWFVYLLMRFSPLDIRIIPGIGPLLLVSLALVMLAPLVAILLAAAAFLREPRVAQNLLTLGCAIGALVVQVLLFTVNKWL